MLNTGRIEGGLGGEGGGGVETGGPAPGSADADGGAGGAGGSIVFVNVEMAPVGSSPMPQGATVASPRGLGEPVSSQYQSSDHQLASAANQPQATRSASDSPEHIAPRHRVRERKGDGRMQGSSLIIEAPLNGYSE